MYVMYICTVLLTKNCRRTHAYSPVPQPIRMHLYMYSVHMYFPPNPKLWLGSRDTVDYYDWALRRTPPFRLASIPTKVSVCTCTCTYILYIPLAPLITKSVHREGHQVLRFLTVASLMQPTYSLAERQPRIIICIIVLNFGFWYRPFFFFFSSQAPRHW